MNAEYFIDNASVPLTQSKFYLNSKKQFTFHIYNSRVHKSKLTLDFLHSHGITIAPRPAYSPDLALSDFFLFGALKGNSQYLEFNSPEEIVSIFLLKYFIVSSAPFSLSVLMTSFKQSKLVNS